MFTIYIVSIQNFFFGIKYKKECNFEPFCIPYKCVSKKTTYICKQSVQPSKSPSNGFVSNTL